MQPIFGNIIWASNSIYRPKFNSCTQFYLLYISIYVGLYTVVVTRSHRDDRRVVLFFYLTYVRIFLYVFIFCFSFIFSRTSLLAVAGKLMIPKILLCFCISTLKK